LNTKAVLALALAILLPLVSYFIIKELSVGAIRMPPRYYSDTVINKVVDGKSVTDTTWHQVANIILTNQLGKDVSLDELAGKIIVVDFFFTRCPSICPTLTKNMKRLQETLKISDVRKRIDSSFVHFLSISVDPERDSVPVLKKYADKYGVNHDSWWLLTGPKKTIYDFSINELKLGLQDTLVSEDFVHTNRFVLLDKKRVVRGYYNGLDTTSLAQLAEDVVILLLEKDKKKKRKIF
jgi:protein SCO1/2